jgi:hypothetical protein
MGPKRNPRSERAPRELVLMSGFCGGCKESSGRAYRNLYVGEALHSYDRE